MALTNKAEIVADSDWLRGDYVPLAAIVITLPDLCEQRGYEFLEYEEDGLGLAYGVGLKVASGTHFYLVDYEGLPGGRRVIINVLNGNRVESVLACILASLNVDIAQVDWITALH